ncbi:MAG: hypothetical protein IT362_03705 [Deltaproteobacteria bacterium]|nr:hypothetical protein [Deltaproteobacteria bacterium]
MPKRTNDFQKLVFLVKKLVAENSIVTESKFLIDLQTGAQREVDICIESSIGGHNITISIECIKHKRKASVTWVETMKAKHERLPTNALVLVSEAGFSKEAQKVAQKYGIETLRFDEVDENSVDRLFGKTEALFFRTFRFTPLKVIARVEEIGELPAEDVDTLPDNIIFKSDGSQLSAIKNYIESILHSGKFIESIGQQGDESHKNFELLIEKTIDEVGNPLCLRKENPLIIRKIAYIKVSGTCEISPPSKFPIKYGKLGSVQVAWGTGQFLEKDALLVATQDDTGGRKLTISTKA